LHRIDRVNPFVLTLRRLDLEGPTALCASHDNDFLGYSVRFSTRRFQTLMMQTRARLSGTRLAPASG
jgi:hypothetical protein